ncbi:hypothetical protein NX722_03810 [Endozoicomonas gorgoniicola]|uniref:Uncharacterized protein n=1 Tax=Endozoicomonas gorgoniicola TaxID=1234144 RepID=A0ABT3MQZ1_9GAMM|nr:hypothetical protein [Endozoicomonas gorgoniicola]MCW7551777.1 hypothetical protein [Endozoicomonas gorgoniicola]
MKLKLCLLVIIFQAIATHALTIEECDYFIDQWKSDIEILFNAANSNSVVSFESGSKFLNKKGNFLMYQQGMPFIDWISAKGLIGSTEHFNSHPYNIYMTKYPDSIKNHYSFKAEPKKELHCKYIYHEYYNNLFFCCLVDKHINPLKSGNIYLRRFDIGSF